MRNVIHYSTNSNMSNNNSRSPKMFKPYRLLVSLHIGDMNTKAKSLSADKENMDADNLGTLVREEWPILLRKDGEHSNFDLFKVDMDARSKKESWEFFQRHREMQTLHADRMLDPSTLLAAVYPTPPNRLGLHIMARSRSKLGAR